MKISKTLRLILSLMDLALDLLDALSLKKIATLKLEIAISEASKIQNRLREKKKSFLKPSLKIQMDAIMKNKMILKTIALHLTYNLSHRLPIKHLIKIHNIMLEFYL